MKRFTTFFLLISFFAAFSLQAQQKICKIGDKEALIERLKKNKERIEQGQITSRAETSYIPIKFHLVARSNGTGRVGEDEVYAALCRLNKAYEQFDMQFYLKGNSFNKIDSDAAYNEPDPGMALLTYHKDNAGANAVNIFFTNNLGGGSSGGSLLGFYSPADDWIIIRNDQVGQASTMPHEVGHFFSLLHTFNGWECAPYNENTHGNPVNITTAPCGNVPVELADRSNCEIAGDMLCGTPPDYNFGFNSNSCDFTDQVKDPNGEIVDPMENNFMSYFLQCTNYEFTDDQGDVVLSDYNSPQRDYLRNSQDPPVIDQAGVTLNYPQNGDTASYRDFIEFDWEPVDGATYYILEIDIFTTFSNPIHQFVIEGNTEFTFEQTLSQNPFESYFYRIIPANRYNVCFDDNASDVVEFYTGAGNVAVEDISRNLSWEIFPNPVSEADEINIKINSKKSQKATFQLIDARGSVVHSQEEEIMRGVNSIDLSSEAQGIQGLYFIQITTENARAAQRIVIQ